MTNQDSKSHIEKSFPEDELNIGRDVSKSVIIKGDGNTVNIHDSVKIRKKRTTKNKKTNPLIVVAWIGFLGSVLVALIGTIGTNLSLIGAAGSEDNNISIATSTSTITPTTSPNSNEIINVPVVPLVKDWREGCISKLWLTYPSTIQAQDKGNGCWQEPIHAFSAENGELDFLYERQKGAEEIYGLFAPLPIERGSLNLTIRLRDLSNADLLIGIFSQPEVKSPGLMMMMLNGGVESNVFIQKDTKTYETILGSQKIFQGTGYSITFEFDDLSVRSVINPSVFFIDPFSLPSSQKYLFLGYKGLRGYYRIEGTFLNFDLK